MSGLTYFGSEAATQLQQWQNSRRKLTFAEELSDGGSGARLAFVYHEGDVHHPQQKLLLKLCAEDEGAVTEPRDLEAAWESGPAYHEGARTFDFPKRRLISQAYPPIPVGNTWLMFLEIALDERARHPLKPLSTLRPSAAKARVAGAVIHSILTEWNPSQRADHNMAGQTFLLKALGHRAAPDSRLAHITAELLGPDQHRTSVRLLGWPTSLPNPTPFADHPPLANLKPPTVALGRAHYDLHPGNIMVATQPLAPDSFRLVDLSRFQEEGLLSRDPVHLMLCLVCEYLPELSEQARTELAALLLEQDEDTADPHESLLPSALLSTIQLLRTAPEPWRKARHYAHPDWYPQYLLAVQACALMFLTRRTTREDQLWLLRLAANACAGFQTVAKPLNQHHPAPEPPSDLSATADKLPPALHAELAHHQQQLEHLRTRCADPRFDTALIDNLRIVVSRCIRLAGLAHDGPRTEAALAFHDQCTAVVQSSEALQTAHHRPSDQGERETARKSFVTALTRLLEHPDRSAPRPGLELQTSSGDSAAQQRMAAVDPKATDSSDPKRPGVHGAITATDAKAELPPYAAADGDAPQPTLSEPPIAKVLRPPKHGE
ncbi:hypothetical protein AB0N62_43155 [Streptomyces sp. NPDC093982]|uniref:hypothetical protein n=1 Tax=Streptomyces sp. NPDC093982 TaxID=3155077 RepID=UPI00342D29AE